MLKVGIPKEIKSLEKRVGLTPSAVHQLTARNIPVFVERHAGEASGFSDDDYRKSGAEVLPDAASLYASADLIQKVKEPLESEFPHLRKTHLLFCYLHLASPENCALVEALVRSGAMAIGYETVELDGRFPLLAPMSEIAGALAVVYGAVLRDSGFEKSSVLNSAGVFSLLEKAAAEYPEFKSSPNPGKVAIFGGGVAGFKSLETVLRLKGEPYIIEKNPMRQEFLKRFTRSVFSPTDSLKQTLESADILIGSVHARGARAACVFDDKALKDMSKHKSKIIIDIAIDQGGNFPQSGPTTYKDAVYFDSYHNLRFGVPNMPSLCGKGASEALSLVTLPYTLQLADDFELAFQRNPELSAGINIKSGQILLDVIRQAHKRL